MSVSPLDFRCPTCKAGVYEPCEGDGFCPTRKRKVPSRNRYGRLKGKKKTGSVWSIPAGGFETNRRRH